jgi:hypothetical protein
MLFNKIRTVNGGWKLFAGSVNGDEPIECLSHHFHNPNCDIICGYYLDGLGTKIEVTYYRYLGGTKEGHEIYFFPNADAIQHYYSRRYDVGQIPEKYKRRASYLKTAFKYIDFDAMKKRPEAGQWPL